MSIGLQNNGFQNLLLNSGFKLWTSGTSVAPDGWTLTGSGSIAREGTIKLIGSYSSKITSDADGNYLEQEMHTIRGVNYWKGRTVTLSCWVYAADASNAKITIADGVGSTSSAFHTGGSGWELLSVTRVIDASASKVELQLNCDGNTKIAYFDGAMLTEGIAIFAFTPHPADALAQGLTSIEINEDGIKIGGGGATIDEFSTDDTLAGDSDTAVPTEKAVKTYADAVEVAAAAAADTALGEQKLNEHVAPDGSVDFNDQQAIDFIIENRTNDTGMTVTGQIWFRTDV